MERQYLAAGNTRGLGQAPLVPEYFLYAFFVDIILKISCLVMHYWEQVVVARQHCCVAVLDFSVRMLVSSLSWASTQVLEEATRYLEESWDICLRYAVCSVCIFRCCVEMH